MKKNALKNSLPFVLSAAVAFTAVSGVVSIPAMEGTPVVASTAYAAAASKTYDFSKDIGAWKYAGNYGYSGAQPEVTYDPQFDGSMKVTVDFSGDSGATWSEVKLTDAAITKEAPVELSNCNQVSFDLYYDASKIGGDALLKAKVYGKDVSGEEVMNDVQDNIGMSFAEEVPGTTFKKCRVRVPLMDTFTGKLAHFEISIVSYTSSYNGAVYINNIEM